MFRYTSDDDDDDGKDTRADADTGALKCALLRIENKLLQSQIENEVRSPHTNLFKIFLNLQNLTIPARASIHTGPTTANTAVNTNALDKTLKHKVTMTNAPNVVKKTMTHPVKRNVAAEAVVNAPPMTDGPTERIAWSAHEARR